MFVSDTEWPIWWCLRPCDALAATPPQQSSGSCSSPPAHTWPVLSLRWCRALQMSWTVLPRAVAWKISNVLLTSVVTGCQVDSVVLEHSSFSDATKCFVRSCAHCSSHRGFIRFLYRLYSIYRCGGWEDGMTRRGFYQDTGGVTEIEHYVKILCKSPTFNSLKIAWSQVKASLSPEGQMRDEQWLLFHSRAGHSL